MNNEGIDMDEIYKAILWLSIKGKKVAGGRNFSVIHDQRGEEQLATNLFADENMYKLRRYGNDWIP